MPVEMPGGIESPGGGGLRQSRVGHRSSGVGGPVFPVRSPAQDHRVPEPLHAEPKQGGKHEFLVPAALPRVRTQGHRGLPSGEETGRRRDRGPVLADALGKVGQGESKGSTLPFESRGEHEHAVAAPARLPGRGVEGCLIRSQHGVSHARARPLEGLRESSRRPLSQVTKNGAGHALGQPVLVEYEKRVGVGGGIGRGGTGGDDVEPVADHVGHEESRHPRTGGGDEPPPLHPGQVFPHRVHLPDGGAGGEEEIGHRLLVGQAHSLRGGRPEGGAASGEKADEEIAGAQGPGQGEHALGSQDPRGGGTVVVTGARGMEHDGADRPPLECRHVDPALDRERGEHAGTESLGQASGHGRAGLPRAHHGQLAHAAQRHDPLADPQRLSTHAHRAPDEPIRAHGVEPARPDRRRIVSQSGRLAHRDRSQVLAEGRVPHRSSASRVDPSPN